jgi:hypothetical protein|tara:strand:- start:1826 stop:2737 length:912 start_codon:yes stop_codon:yes gene_type:complete
MINICTLADQNFTLRFLALRDSIRKYTSDYKINLLCLDDKIYNTVKNNCEEVFCHNIKDLIESDPKLKECQFNKPSYEALNVCNNNAKKAQRLQFIWSLASYYSWFCLFKQNLEDIIYVDADIYFFQTPEKLVDLRDLGSIGLIENRVPYSAANGLYNVGIVYFKNDTPGRKCLEFWKECLLNQNNKYAKEYGTCGDQKYLELFPKMFNKIFSFDEYVGHLAPWSVNYHKYAADKIIWNGKVQSLLFYHFSNFSVDFKNKSYIPASRHGILNIKNNIFVSSLYDQYFKNLEQLNENIIWHDSV